MKPLFLDKEILQRYNRPVSNGLVAQLGAHRIRIAEVEGSNPFKSTNKNAAFGRLFLLVDLRKRFEPLKCNSPGFAKDGITEYRYIAYLLPTYQDFPQYNSIYPDNRYHF